jgi:hypothetical protein
VIRPACLLALGLATACESADLTQLEVVVRCPETRVASDGTCCPAWTAWDDERCLLRPWQSDGDPQAEPGAGPPRLSVDGTGRALLVWSTDTGEVVIGEETSEGDLDLVRPSATFDGLGLDADVATAPDGRALVAWKQQRSDVGSIYVAERNAEGGWSLPTAAAVTSSEGTAYEPRVAFGPRDTSVVLWNQWTGANYQVAIMPRAADGRIAPATLVAPPVNFSNAPRIALASNGDGMVAWYQAVSGDLGVYVSERFRLDGDWIPADPARPLSRPGTEVASHPDSNPIPVLNARGLGAVAWTQPTPAGGHGVFLATRDGFGEWTTPGDLADTIGDPLEVARCVQPALTEGGRLYLTWYVEGDVAQVLAWDAQLDGAPPRPDPVVLSDPTHSSVDPAIAIGREGEAVLVYREQVDGAWRIVERRRHPDVDVWLPRRVLSDPAAGSVGTPTVAIGPDGRTVAAWSAGPLGDQRIYLAWIDPSR